MNPSPVPSLVPGLARTLTYRVHPRDLVNALFPDAPEFARKPAVLATGILVALCEWPAMDALRQVIGDDEDSLGTKVCITHQAPVWVGTTLTVTAQCASVSGRSSRWDVCVQDGTRMVARGWVQFAVVRTEAFLKRHTIKSASVPARPGVTQRVPKQYARDDQGRIISASTGGTRQAIRV